MTTPINPIVVLVIEASDLDASARLHREAFGIPLEVKDHGGEDRWTGGRHASYSFSALHFAIYQAKSSITSGAQIGLVVSDVARAHEIAVAAGASVVHEPREDPDANWGQTSRYLDPDGNVVSLTQSRRH